MKRDLLSPYWSVCPIKLYTYWPTNKHFLEHPVSVPLTHTLSITFFTDQYRIPKIPFPSMVSTNERSGLFATDQSQVSKNWIIVQTYLTATKSKPRPHTPPSQILNISFRKVFLSPLTKHIVNFFTFNLNGVLREDTNSWEYRHFDHPLSC